VLRRALIVAIVFACAGGVVAYQVTRPSRAPASPRVFVPSPEFFLDFSPSFRTSIADAYYLNMVQYFGEHVMGDGRLDSLPEMVDLVTRLSPHFTKAHIFGSFALIDAGKPQAGFEVLKRGYAANPDDWKFPAYLAYFVYTFASNEDKDRLAAKYYEQAAAIPGSPEYLQRLAAAMLAKRGQTKKAILMYGQAYLVGDKYARQRAVEGLDAFLPADKETRMRALAPLVGTMPEDELNALIADLFGGT
jgi:tetratricopeptide (TPR) repeat protein